MLTIQQILIDRACNVGARSYSLIKRVTSRMLICHKYILDLNAFNALPEVLSNYTMQFIIWRPLSWHRFSQDKKARSPVLYYLSNIALLYFRYPIQFMQKKSKKCFNEPRPRL